MIVVDAEQMRRIDAETIQTTFPGIELMERAGNGAAEVIHHHYGDSESPKASIFVGAGNNGGDGLVIARRLLEAGWRCTIHLLKSPEELTPDTAKNYKRLEALDAGARLVEYQATRPDWIEQAESDVIDADVIVDAILGTGAKGAPHGLAQDMIQLINDQDAPVVAIDMPSGVDASTGETPGEAVEAAHTLTIGCPKRGSLFHPGKFHCGAVAVIDIGFPDEIVEKHAEPLFLLDAGEASSMIPFRDPAAHKFDVGVLTLVAGSRQYRGAALLAAEGAYRAGCGMVYLCVPASIAPALDVSLREAVVVPLPETADGTVSPEAMETLRPLADRSHAVAIGPGLGRNDETDAFVRSFVADADVPVVIDADAITAFAGHAADLGAANADLILTPHSGELARLTGEEIPETTAERIETVRRLASELEVTLIHKGAPSLVVDPVDGVWVNTAGSTALATGGTGDVLTGMVAGFLAQGAEPLEAACVGSFVHARAGDRAAAELSKRGVMASDLFWASGAVLVDLETMAGD